MDYPDPSNFLDILFHSKNAQDTNAQNRAFYQNPQVDQLLDDAHKIADEAKRIDVYKRASDIIAHDAPWAFAFSNTVMEIWQPYVRDYRPHPVWKFDYRNSWLDLPRKRIGGGTK